MQTKWNITSVGDSKAQDLVLSYDDDRKELSIIDPDTNSQVVIFMDKPKDFKNQINFILDIITKLGDKSPSFKPAKSNFMERIRMKFPNAYKKWEKVDDLKLTEMFNSGVSNKDIAEKFQRKYSAIRQRLIKLRLIN